MNPDLMEELTWATMRQREEDARASRPHSGLPRTWRPFRSRLARTLVHAGLHLDHEAGDLAERHRDLPPPLDDAPGAC